MFEVIPASPIAISCIAGIGIQQAETAAACDMNSVIPSAIDANLDRSTMTACILIWAKGAFCEWRHSAP
jgi:hypothetical protein